MTGRDPDISAEDELRSMRQQLHIYEAVSTAAGDAHAVLDVLLAPRIRTPPVTRSSSATASRRSRRGP
jgi:hypothetical protein